MESCRVQCATRRARSLSSLSCLSQRTTRDIVKGMKRLEGQKGEQAMKAREKKRERALANEFQSTVHLEVEERDATSTLEERGKKKKGSSASG